MAAEATKAEDTEDKGGGEEENEDTSGSPNHGDGEAKDEGDDGAAKTIQVCTSLSHYVAQFDHIVTI